MTGSGLNKRLCSILHGLHPPLYPQEQGNVITTLMLLPMLNDGRVEFKRRSWQSQTVNQVL